MLSRRSFILSTGALIAAPSISFSKPRQVTRMVIGGMRCGKSAYGAFVTYHAACKGVQACVIGEDLRHGIHMLQRVYDVGKIGPGHSSIYLSNYITRPSDFAWIDENAPDNLIDWALANCEEVVWTTCPNAQAARYLDRFQYKRYMEIKTNWQV